MIYLQKNLKYSFFLNLLWLKFQKHKKDYLRIFLFVKNVKAKLEQTPRKYLKEKLSAENVGKKLLDH